MARISAEQWVERVTAWESSGRTATAFAAARGLDARRLRWWKWKLSREGRLTRPAFVPAHMPDDAAKIALTSVEVRFPNGLVVHVPMGFDSRALVHVLDAARAATC